jgi:hypothetical protein
MRCFYAGRPENHGFVIDDDSLVTTDGMKTVEVMDMPIFTRWRSRELRRAGHLTQPAGPGSLNRRRKEWGSKTREKRIQYRYK